MGSIPVLLPIILFWIFIHLRRRQVFANRTPLPTTVATSRNVSSYGVLWKLGLRTKVLILSPITLRAETTVFVTAHSRLLRLFSGKDDSWGNSTQRFYDAGTVLAVYGQLFGICSLFWSISQLGIRVLNSGNPVVKPTLLLKRGVSIHKSSKYFLRPLIPGLTLPFSHLGYVLVSLITCTFIHEAGHALAAMAEGLSLVSWGYSLFLVVPIAFVELSSTFTSHQPLQRLRIATAGPFHNLLTFLLVVISLSIPIPLWSWLGYRSVNAGVAIVDVQESSPLYAHLFPGWIVTSLNDIPLATSSPITTWNEILLGETQEMQGWCVDASWFKGGSQSCCSLPAQSQNGSESCFALHPFNVDAGQGHCVDSLLLFENRMLSRCTSNQDCPTDDICITPHRETSLLRLAVVREEDEEERIVVWRGPNREIWEQVTVGRYLPRISFFWIGLPHTISLLLEYIKTTSISLFFFNLLPIQALDGGEIFEAILNLTIPQDNGEEDDLEAGILRRMGHVPTQWIRTIRRTVDFTMLSLVCVVFISGTMMHDGNML